MLLLTANLVEQSTFSLIVLFLFTLPLCSGHFYSSLYSTHVTVAGGFRASTAVKKVIKVTISQNDYHINNAVNLDTLSLFQRREKVMRFRTTQES